MATPSNVIRSLDLLTDAGLDFTPRDVDRLADIWVKILNDIPDPILTQAVTDYLLTETKWPAPAKIRVLAERVKAHNGKSAAPNQFKDETRVMLAGEVPGVYRATQDGPARYRQGEHVDRVTFPPEVQAEIERLAARDTLLTGEQMERIDALTAPYKGEACTTLSESATA